MKNIGGSYNCVSRLYEAHSTVCVQQLTLKSGVNVLFGDIDSGGWGISRAMSMPENFKYRGRKYRAFPCPYPVAAQSEIYVDGRESCFEELGKTSCYLDCAHKLYRPGFAVKASVEKGLKISGLAYNAQDIMGMFEIAPFRFERPLKAVGNECWRAMAAIGFANGKQIFCFPWLSAKMVEYFYYQLTAPMNKLAELGATVVLPTTYNFREHSDYNIVDMFEAQGGYPVGDCFDRPSRCPLAQVYTMSSHSM